MRKELDGRQRSINILHHTSLLGSPVYLFQLASGEARDLGASSTISIKGISSPVAAPSSLNFLAGLEHP